MLLFQRLIELGQIYSRGAAADKKRPRRLIQRDNDVQNQKYEQPYRQHFIYYTQDIIKLGCFDAWSVTPFTPCCA